MPEILTSDNEPVEQAEARACACCGKVYHRTAIHFEPGDSDCGHFVCEECQESTKPKGYTSWIAPCAACEEEKR